MYAGVHLPQGARIWGWRAHIQRSYHGPPGERIGYAGSCSVSLNDYNIVGNGLRLIGQEKTTVFEEEPGPPGEWRRILYETDLDHTVDNKNSSYFLRVGWPCNQRGILFAGAFVIYQAS